jgi:4-hydroxy-tetrahydrodipicolinate synthase
MVYNVPSRTGRTIDVETTVSLARHPNIQGYKAASGDLGLISEVVERTRDEDFVVVSGDDGLTLPIQSVGGRGAVSVAANVEPERVADLVWAANEDDYATAREAHHELGGLFRAIFAETNPIPIKEALYVRDDHENPPVLRSPLSRLSEDHREELAAVLDAL